MKKTVLLLASAIAISGLVSACGSPVKTTTTTDQKVSLAEQLTNRN